MFNFRTASKFSSRLKRKLKSSEAVNTLDNTCIEFALFLLWKINIINLIKTKAALSKEFKISPIDIDNMTMWEYELWIDALNNQIKEDNDAQQSEMDKYDVDKYKKMAENPNKMVPNMSNMKFDFSRMKF